MFASEVVHGGRVLSRAVRRHMHAVAEKAKVFECWMKAGLMDPVDLVHLFILLWGATQFYADSGVMAKNGLGVKRLTRAHFTAGAETIAQIVLNGSAEFTRHRHRPRACPQARHRCLYDSLSRSRCHGWTICAIAKAC